jgi:hypothetical protein
MQADRPSRRSRLLVAGTLVAAAAALAALLMAPPIVGLADNGDFDRVMLPAGLATESSRPEDRFVGWMQPRFAYAPRSPDVSGYRTTELFLVEVARAAGRLFSRAPRFVIRFLGAVHAALLLLAIGLIVSACGGLSAAAQVSTAALLAFFFTDVGYAAPFQSLYSQTASLLFLLLTAGLFAHAVRRGRLTGLWLPAYFLCAAMFVCSKPQESVQAVLLAAFGIRLAWGAPRRARVTAVVFAVALCALAWRYYRSAVRSAGWITRYNLLFLEMLPGSPDPARDLEELGLDPSLARFSGVSGWVPESPVHIPEVRAFMDRRSGQPSPRLFYLRHPRRFAALLARVATSSYVLQPNDLGNFAKESGAPPGTKAFGLWSALRIRLSGVPWLVTLFGSTLAAAAATHRRASPRGKLFREGLGLLVAMAAGAFLVTALGDSRGETARHLYAFQAMCDLILVADAAWVVQTIATRRGARKARSAFAPAGSRSGEKPPLRFSLERARRFTQEAVAGNHRRVATQARHTESITGTSTRTPTIVARAAPDPGP